MDATYTVMDIQSFSQRLLGNLEQVIVGKRNVLELALIGLLCQGHILIEDVPGVGKTMLARSLARSSGVARRNPCSISVPTATTRSLKACQ